MSGLDVGAATVAPNQRAQLADGGEAETDHQQDGEQRGVDAPPQQVQAGTPGVLGQHDHHDQPEDQKGHRPLGHARAPASRVVAPGQLVLGAVAPFRGIGGDLVTWAADRS